MSHKNIPNKSRHDRLQRMTKEQVKDTIRNKGSFHGYICGSSVKPTHIAQSWNLGEEIYMDDIDTFEAYMLDFESALFHYAPELGPHVNYYQIVDKRTSVQNTRLQYGRPSRQTIKELQP